MEKSPCPWRSAQAMARAWPGGCTDGGALAASALSLLARLRSIAKVMSAGVIAIHSQVRCRPSRQGVASTLTTGAKAPCCARSCAARRPGKAWRHRGPRVCLERTVPPPARGGWWPVSSATTAVTPEADGLKRHRGTPARRPTRARPNRRISVRSPSAAPRLVPPAAASPLPDAARVRTGGAPSC